MTFSFGKCANPDCKKDLGYLCYEVRSAYSATPERMWIRIAKVCSIACLARFAELKSEADQKPATTIKQICRWDNAASCMKGLLVDVCPANCPGRE